MMNRRLLVIVTAALLATGCATRNTGPLSLADAIAADPSLSTFHGLAVKSGLNGTLKGPGPFTVFAPTNEAFKAVPAKTMDELAKDPARLQSLLAYHVVAGKLAAAQVRNGKVKATSGADLALARAGDFVTVEEAMVQTADISAANGVLHTLDRVLTPPKR